jgi:hypothetical protein
LLRCFGDGAWSVRIDGIGTTRLEAFMDGRAELSVAQLQQLTNALYPHSEYNPETGLLQSANKTPPRLLGVAAVRSDDIGRSSVRSAKPWPMIS